MTFILDMNVLIVVTTAALLLSGMGIHAWIPTIHRYSPKQQQQTAYSSWISLTKSSPHPYPLYSSSGVNDDKQKEPYKIEGERIIRYGAIRAGAKEEQITIDWKADKIIVTIDGSAYIPGVKDGDDDNEDDDGLEMEVFEDPNAEFDLDGFPDDTTEESPSSSKEEDNVGVDVASIARSINAAFEEEGEGTMGYNVAVNHSIDVTTPGTSDELVGDIMFEAYKGFDVIARIKDPKKKSDKLKTVEGKLVGRTDDITTVNVKGRMRKLKNNLIVSIKLPKAKREKGAR
mmetsp:Transcript_18655/g.25881  ORF Transcript_18655/g.25881 Transcript_18655/m.25881 type:complete len:287 (-) Transcript_18655:144-1004(-)